MLHVYALKDTDSQTFIEMFGEYYRELDCDEDGEHLAREYVIPDYIAGVLKIDLIAENNAVCGFAVYQTDDIDNDWNKKEGWGDIREIYISPSYRKKGSGKFLLYSAEMKLKLSGANKAYCLPCEGAAGFFEHCGYVRTDEYCEELDCNFYIKNNLNNGCHNE